VSHTLYPRIRHYLHRTGRNPFHTVCHGCYHPPPHCRCEERSRWIGCAYFAIVFAIVLFCFLYPILQPRKTT
jgi:hypothetical protein